MSYIKAPKPKQQEMYDYLEELRKSGDTNMFGAAPYLEAAFGIGNDKARVILSDWIKGHSDPARILSSSTTKRKAGRMVTQYVED